MEINFIETGAYLCGPIHRSAKAVCLFLTFLVDIKYPKLKYKGRAESTIIRNKDGKVFILTMKGCQSCPVLQQDEQGSCTTKFSNF